MKSILRSCFVGLVALALPALSPIPAAAATFEVNSVLDPAPGSCDPSPGDCTLREAIVASNATTAVDDTITFNIDPDAPIVVATTIPAGLPALTDTVIIDGFSDPTSERVELDGSSAGAGADGLRLSTADGSTIKGLVINGFSEDGIHIQSGATLNRVEGNYIGTNAAGTVADANGAEGVHVEGENNTIGGSTAEARNVISGNTSNGVRIASPTAGGNVVAGNYIGTDAAGSAALANGNSGVVLTSAANGNVIGGTSAAARNVISGNGESGVRIFGAGTTGNLVQGNLISGNTRDGVEIEGDSTVVGNAVLGNSISGNGNSTVPHDEMGIDLVGANGVDANDAGDADTGPNNLQNFPVLTSAASNATTTTISGTMSSEAIVRTYRLEFFSNAACDPSGNGEGQTFLGSINVTTDGAGNATFTASLPVGTPVGQVATATATDPANNTSEFSACRTVAFDPTPPVSPDTTPPTTPATNAGPRFQRQRMFPVAWSASTDAIGPVRYDVRYREAPYNGGFGAFVNWQSGLTATNATFTGTPGTTYCFSARAIDGAGNASPYGSEGCTAVPVDNTSFKHRGKWAKRSGAGYYLNTFSRTKQRGARLTLPGVQAKVLSLIVTKCRRCGVIKVFFKGKLLKRINLRSKAAARKKLRFVNLTTFTSVQTGTLRVRVVSRGKLVIIEGLGVSAV